MELSCEGITITYIGSEINGESSNPVQLYMLIYNSNHYDYSNEKLTTSLEAQQY